MEELLQRILTEVTGLKAEVAGLKQEVNEIKIEQKAMRRDIDKLKDLYEIMDGRQKEMYLILKGWEEDRPITKTVLDRLAIDMDKIRNHKHNIVLPTEKAEAI